MKRSYTPLFPVTKEIPDYVPPDRECAYICGTGDRWRFMLLWQHEPRTQYTGIEVVP